MKYKAIYWKKGIADEAAIALKSIVEGDTYYAMHGGFGTGLLSRSRSNGVWDDDFFGFGVKLSEFDSLSSVDIREHLKSLTLNHQDSDPLKGFYGWETCAGNMSLIRFDSEDQITVYMEGRRHGIVDWFSHILEGATISVILYETMCPEALPFESGLVPKGKIEQLTQDIKKNLPDIETLPVLKAQELFEDYVKDKNWPFTLKVALAEAVNLR